METRLDCQVLETVASRLPKVEFASAIQPLRRGTRFGEFARKATLSTCGQHKSSSRFQPLCMITESLIGTSNSESTSLPNKRRLVLLRHAKSSWADPSLKDHDRPLNEHGRQAAARISTKLQQGGWLPELILCSDSTRTRETLDIMKKHVPKLLEVEVHFLGSFYSVSAMDGQTAQHLQHIICKYSRDDISTVMCMGHNRGWEEAASIFSGASVELKTANAALLEACGNSWQEVQPSTECFKVISWSPIEGLWRGTVGNPNPYQSGYSHENSSDSCGPIVGQPAAEFLGRRPLCLIWSWLCE